TKGSLIVIGAGGSLGHPLVEETQRQKSRFAHLVILSDTAKAHKFTDVQENGIKVVLGSYLDLKSYTGTPRIALTSRALVGSALMRLQSTMIDAALADGV
ncbi:hypothetical protein FB451DRAFT_939538, partial [Mycena latifolia]